MKKLLLHFTCLLSGAILFSLSLTLFLDPARLVTGGVSGVAILLSHLFGISVGKLFLAINIPILLVGIFILGSRFMVATLTATLLSSLFTDLFAHLASPFLPLTADPILSALFGGILCGIGLGLVFRGGGTTGGTDVGVRLLRLKYPHIREGIFFFIIDMTVVIASAFVFRSFESALYSTVALVACSKSVDTVLYGTMEERLVLIVTEKPEAIGERLMRELSVGITYLNGISGYTKSERKIILSALRTKLYPRLSEIVSESDPSAFTIVTTAKEIFGEGFLRYPEKIRQKNKANRPKKRHKKRR